MKIFLLILATAAAPAYCPMQKQHQSGASHQPGMHQPTATQHQTATHDHTGMHHHAAVDQRGDHVMGFSHEKTKHTFRLFADGGAVEVRANDVRDAESVAAIRKHLKEIAADFAKGDFGKPRRIHDRVPEGVPVMKELGDGIVYRYEELERGGRVRITTSDPRGVAAVHQFLRFQIDDHRTGDAGNVEPPM